MNKLSEFTFNGDILEKLIKSNLSCHANKVITVELIDIISVQIIDTIIFHLKEQKGRWNKTVF